MNTVPQSVADTLSNCGFVRDLRKPSLFLVEDPQTVTPAYHCIVLKRRGKVQLGGAIGLYFRDFERIWADSLSSSDSRNDATLPLIMLIDNYLELIEGYVFRYSDLHGLKKAAEKVYSLARKLPCSLAAFDQALHEGRLLGKPVSDYLHISGYHDSDNLYFRKSASFVRWFIQTFPSLASHMRDCLTSSQLQRLDLQ